MILDDEDDGEGVGAGVHIGRLRQNQKLSERWRGAVAKRNQDTRGKLELRSPLEGLKELEELRSLPPMPWPAAWPQLARRCRTYPGDILGILGAIGGGKTSLAIQICLAAIGAGIPVIWAPLELGEAQISIRIVANLHGVHAALVRDEWPIERIEATLTAVTDMWRFVDRVRVIDPEEHIERQIAACETAIELAWSVYGMPPVFCLDHIHQLVAAHPDETRALRSAALRLEEMTQRQRCFTILLSQGSVASQQVLTGRIDKDAAADMIGADSGGKAIGSVATNCIAVATFKEDDASALDAHANVSKSRHAGGEGRVGMRFSKPGGVWTELDYLPATPSAVRESIEAAKKDKHRAMPPPSPPAARAELNAMRAVDEAGRRRGYIHEAIARHGALGMEASEIRKVRGAGRGAAVHQALQELERVGAIERTTNGRWRVR